MKIYICSALLHRATINNTCLVIGWLMLLGERFKCWMELGIRVEAACPLRMVLGPNHTSGSGRETRRTGRRDVPGPRQFRRPLPAQPELSVVRPNAAHAD